MSTIENKKRVNAYRLNILKYINNESHVYIGTKKTTIRFDDLQNVIVCFDKNDLSHEFFEHEPLPKNLSYQDYLLNY